MFEFVKPRAETPLKPTEYRKWAFLIIYFCNRGIERLCNRGIHNRNCD